MKRGSFLLGVDVLLGLLLARWPAVVAVLGGPHHPSWVEVERWYDRAEPAAIVAVAGAGVLGLVLAWLVLVTSLQLVTEVLPAGPRLRGWVDAISPPVLCRLGGAVGSASLTATLLLGPLSGAPTGSARPAPTSTSETARLVPIAPAPTPEPAATPPPSAPLTSVVVQPGDCFWSIAEQAVAGGLGAPPTDRQVAAYWLRLMDLNRDRLVVAGAFDLIYPGQVFELPEPGGGSATELPETL
jgi:hypothetical protein